jgi:hypothetical protein
MVGTGFLIDQAERLKDIGEIRKRQLLTIVTGREFLGAIAR